jgi:hypothetical protein
LAGCSGALIPRAENFAFAAGLSLLRDCLANRFVQGFVLHLGADSLPLGDRIWAVPLAGPWSE